MPTIQEDFSAALHYGARAWRLALDKRLKHLGLGSAGWMTVAIAAKANAPMSQSELAAAVGVEGATMVAMIDRLVAAGLVERQAAETDRRIKRIAVTRAGMALYAQVKAEADAFRREMLSDEDEKLLAKATTLLQRVREKAEGVAQAQAQD
jgi:MarR family transcriptional regulator for hemolysin